MKNLLLFCLLSLLTACAVPKTTIRFNPLTRELVVYSPKDITIGSLTATIASNQVQISLTNYSSSNNAAVINAANSVGLEAIRATAQAMDTASKLIK